MLSLVVIGDSHGQLWSGKDCLGKGDTLPGIKTYFIDGPSAYSLVNNHHSVKTTFFKYFNETIASLFNGWIMLSFGEVDCRTKLQTFPNILKATDLVVDQYFNFLLDIKNLYKQICVWAPPATAVAGTHSVSTNVDDEIKRNITAYYFNRQLSRKLMPEKIPMFSLLPYMVNDDLTTKRLTTFDFLHARQETRHIYHSLVEKILLNYNNLSVNEVFTMSYNHSLADILFKSKIETI